MLRCSLNNFFTVTQGVVMILSKTMRYMGLIGIVSTFCLTHAETNSDEFLDALTSFNTKEVKGIIERTPEKDRKKLVTQKASWRDKTPLQKLAQAYMDYGNDIVEKADKKLNAITASSYKTDPNYIKNLRPQAIEDKANKQKEIQSEVSALIKLLVNNGANIKDLKDYTNQKDKSSYDEFLTAEYNTYFAPSQKTSYTKLKG